MQLPSIDKCCGCAACVDACPQNAIDLTEDRNFFFVPNVDASKCVDCGLCEKICPALHTEKVQKHDARKAKVYAAWSIDEELILKSASGGVFAQLAKDFLSAGDNVVCGAALMQDSTVKHISITDVADLHQLQNSKYQQSDTTGIYKKVRECLKNGNRVLFSGTPCQVSALYASLPTSLHENLFTAEVVCHGVPTNYLSRLALRVEKAERIVAYRTKSKGWEQGGRSVFAYANGNIVEKQRFNQDFLFRSYLTVSFNRKSCLQCPYAEVNRVADVTLGDFWGLDKSKYNNKGGVSVLIVNTDKGAEMVKKSSQLHCENATWREILPGNTNLFMPVNNAVFDGANRVCKVSKMPLFVQKTIMQNGFTFRPLKMAYMAVYQLVSCFKRKRAQKERNRRLAETLQYFEQ